MEPGILPGASGALGLAGVLAPPRVARARLLTWGLLGLAGMGESAIGTSLALVILIFLVLAVLQARLTSHRDLATRLRAPMLAVVLLALGLVLERMQGPVVLERFGAVGIVAGLVAAVGLLPYAHEFDPEESVVASPVPWIAFVGPLLAAAVVAQASEVVPADAGDAFGAMLIGLGLLNTLR